MNAPDPGQVRIELLTEARIPACWQLRLRALRDHPEAFGQPHEEAIAIPLEEAHETLRQRMLTANSATFGAFEADGNLVGMTGIIREQRIKNAHRMTIWGVFVAPEARGRGLGERMLDAAIAHARTTRGVLQIHLTVVRTNVIATRTYARAGFVR